MAMLMHGGVNYSGTTGSNTITLTQAEYDSLPVEEQMDPEKVYYITDGVPTSTTVIPNPVTPATEDLNTLQIEEKVYQIAGNGGSQIYDDTERVIGTWFGDTLYQKTIYDAGGRSSSFSINHGITNLKAVIGYSGCVTDATFPLPLPRIAYDGNNVGVQSASATEIGICNPSAFGTRLIDWYITLQYTKTTD